MPTVLFRFPALRYHATPWGHHVNEGLVEWPPSPWRLLRALIACGYNAGVWSSEGLDPISRQLVEKLASVLPQYKLPTAVGAHSRHYMPGATLEKGREKTALVFDTWAQIDTDQDLAVHWAVDLASEETNRLAELIEKLGYLGRSESWVEGRLARQNESSFEPNCFPITGTFFGKAAGLEQVTLYAPQAPAEYEVWRIAAVEDALKMLSPSQNGGRKINAADRKILAAREAKQALFPVDLVAALQTDTRWLRQHGWNQPPGSHRITYWRPANSLHDTAPSNSRPKRIAKTVEAMLLSLTSSSGNRGLLPPTHRALHEADKIHKALVKAAGTYSRVLSGCDEAGAPLKGSHGHAHLFPINLSPGLDDHLDHVLIYAKEGLDAASQTAIRGVRKTWSKVNPENLHLAVVGSGSPSDFRSAAGDAGQLLRSILHQGAREWVSLTPFVPPRFLKRGGRNTLAGQLAAELLARGINSKFEFELLDPKEHEIARRHRHFAMSRVHGAPPPQRLALTIRIRFEEPVSGPISIGHGSHFGLGLFQTEE